MNRCALALQAAAVDAALGNDHVVRVGVDEADGAVVVRLPQRRLGVAGEAPDLRAAGVARGGDGNARTSGGSEPSFQVSA